MTAVRYADTFRKEVDAEIEFVLESGEREWAITLTQDIVELEQLLRSFPEVGSELDRDGARTLRKMRLRRSPFLVWYTADQEKDQVVLARLFHARQLRPEPRLP